MSQSSGNVRQPIARRLALLLALLVLIGCGVALGSLLAGRLRRAESLAVEPPVADLTGTIHPEGEPVHARSRLVNTLAEPVVVKEIGTSCTCTASLVEGGKTLPLTIEPGGAIGFQLEVHPIAQPPDLIQTVRAVLRSECAGQPLPPAVAMVRLRAEDAVKPEPPVIRIGDAPIGEPVIRQVALTTVSPHTKVGPPEVTVSDPKAIRAQVVAGGPGGLFDDRLTSHYRIEVELSAGRGAKAISASIDIRVDGRVRRVPIACTFRRPYRLSKEHIEIAGRPGETAAEEVYYEAREPGWEEPEVVAVPRGLNVAVKPFDAATHVLCIIASVPKPSAPRDELAITLRPKGRDDQITIPIRYDIRE